MDPFGNLDEVHIVGLIEIDWTGLVYGTLSCQLQSHSEHLPLLSQNFVASSIHLLRHQPSRIQGFQLWNFASTVLVCQE
jgi:hypothetical protein